MTWGPGTGARRRGSLVAPLAALGLVVALGGCGSSEPAAEEPGLVIPGSTVTIGTDPPEPTTAAEPTVPTAPTTVPATPSTPPVAGTPVASANLVGRLAAGMTPTSTVTVTTSDGTTDVLAATYRYLGPDQAFLPDCSVQVLDGAGGLAEYRRVGDDVFYRTADDPAWQQWSAGAAPPAAEPVLAEAAELSLLAALAAELDSATGTTTDPAGPTDVGGTPVESYRWTVDSAALLLAGEPDLPSGPVDVRAALDASGRPVRLERTFADGSVLVDTYTGWGEPVSIDDPLAG
ncbi:hypothetical protein [Nocardioides litoris]|uniref:hypothetical protein n=1 Tax=Nocardioides litoris TaxID=1926648 RepID=UPI00112091B0|nr:hypothetical protein [Nocardioides litoris]